MGNQVDTTLHLAYKKSWIDKCDTLESPDWFDSIRVEQLGFGVIPPELTLLDCTDPFVEFYQQSSEHSSELSQDEEEDSLDILFSPEDVASTVVMQGEDIQFKIGVAYHGDLQLTLQTELLLNYPNAGFLRLPIRVAVKSVDFTATLIVAYLRNYLHFCFLKDGQEEFTLDLKIESEIGDQRRQVLKNVGKLERFLVEQLRQFVEQELIFPAFYSLELVSE